MVVPLSNSIHIKNDLPVEFKLPHIVCTVFFFRHFNMSKKPKVPIDIKNAIKNRLYQNNFVVGKGKIKGEDGSVVVDDNDGKPLLFN